MGEINITNSKCGIISNNVCSEINVDDYSDAKLENNIELDKLDAGCFPKKKLMFLKNNTPVQKRKQVE